MSHDHGRVASPGPMSADDLSAGVEAVVSEHAAHAEAI
jgi:hypothetical protein